MDKSNSKVERSRSILNLIGLLSGFNLIVELFAKNFVMSGFYYFSLVFISGFIITQEFHDCHWKKYFFTLVFALSLPIYAIELNLFSLLSAISMNYILTYCGSFCYFTIAYDEWNLSTMKDNSFFRFALWNSATFLAFTTILMLFSNPISYSTELSSTLFIFFAGFIGYKLPLTLKHHKMH